MKTIARILADKSKKRVAKTPLPQFIEPQLATLGEEPPAGENWEHEIKLDGYRLVIKVSSNEVNFYSRNQLDWSSKLQRFAAYFKTLNIESGFFDGEITVLNHEGVSKFQLLQNSLKKGEMSDITLFLFDAMHLNGIDLRPLPLFERREILKRLIGKHKNIKVRLVEPTTASGKVFHKKACQLGLEGIMSKRRDAPYVSGRTKSWMKTKCSGKEEFVIAGYTPHSKQSKMFGALLLGEVTKTGGLEYCGKVGTGFSSQLREELLMQFEKLQTKITPFEASPLLPKSGVFWLKPKLLAEIAFTERTNGGLLRHPSFQGLRVDKTFSDLKKSSDKG